MLEALLSRERHLVSIAQSQTDSKGWLTAFFSVRVREAVTPHPRVSPEPVRCNRKGPLPSCSWTAVSQRSVVLSDREYHSMRGCCTIFVLTRLRH